MPGVFARHNPEPGIAFPANQTSVHAGSGIMAAIVGRPCAIVLDDALLWLQRFVM